MISLFFIVINYSKLIPSHYSFSMSKSLVSYQLGNAICNGHIKSLDDKISNYVPEAKGTLYENSTFKELINMTAGDTNFFANRKAGSATTRLTVWTVGSFQVWREGELMSLEQHYLVTCIP